MVLPLVAAVAVGTSGFAFMAQNTLGASYAGIGTETVTGYNVSNISYVGCSEHPGQICYVNFNAASKTGGHWAGQASVKFNNSGWFTCDAKNEYPAAGRPFMCDLRKAGGVDPAAGNVTVSVLS
jgi:hypothetical protein